MMLRLAGISLRFRVQAVMVIGRKVILAEVYLRPPDARLRTVSKKQTRSSRTTPQVRCPHHDRRHQPLPTTTRKGTIQSGAMTTTTHVGRQSRPTLTPISIPSRRRLHYLTSVIPRHHRRRRCRPAILTPNSAGPVLSCRLHRRRAGTWHPQRYQAVGRASQTSRWRPSPPAAHHFHLVSGL